MKRPLVNNARLARRSAVAPFVATVGAAIALFTGSLAGCTSAPKQGPVKIERPPAVPGTTAPVVPPAPTSAPAANAATSKPSATIAVAPSIAPSPAVVAPSLPANWEPEFAPALELLRGFDRPAVDANWRVGDQLVCSLRFSKGSTRELRFARVTVRTPVLSDEQEVVIDDAVTSPADKVIYLAPIDRASSVDRSNKFVAKSWRHGFNLPDKSAGPDEIRFDSDSILVSLELFDATLQRVSTSHALATEAHLREGLYQLTSELLTVAQDLGPNADQILDADPRKLSLPPRRLLGGVMTLFALRNAIWSAPSITPILNTLVRPPSIFSIIANGGIRFGLDMRFSQIAIEQRPLPVSELATTTAPPLVLPFDILINGEPALRCRVITLPPQPPLQLCAGVVGVDVERPNDRGRSLEFRVLAARRGTMRDVAAR